MQGRDLSKYSRGYVKQGRDIHAVSSGRKNASQVQDEKDRKALFGHPP